MVEQWRLEANTFLTSSRVAVCVSVGLTVSVAVI